jgi:hypothetical protein
LLIVNDLLIIGPPVRDYVSSLARKNTAPLVAATSTFESLVGGFGVKARCLKVLGFTFCTYVKTLVSSA